MRRKTGSKSTRLSKAWVPPWTMDCWRGVILSGDGKFLKTNEFENVQTISSHSLLAECSIQSFPRKTRLCRKTIFVAMKCWCSSVSVAASDCWSNCLEDLFLKKEGHNVFIIFKLSKWILKKRRREAVWLTDKLNGCRLAVNVDHKPKRSARISTSVKTTPWSCPLTSSITSPLAVKWIDSKVYQRRRSFQANFQSKILDVPSNLLTQIKQDSKIMDEI